MITLSLCMIVKNEEDVIGRILECMKGIADEIVIVDTGSTDRTKEIAGAYTSNIYDFEWCDDFAAARNFSFSKATMDYTMWIDADDIIDEHNRNLLIELKQRLSSTVDMVMMKYNVAFDDHDNPTLSYFRERIVKTSNKYEWLGAVHEVIAPSGEIVYEDIAVSHKKVHPTQTGRNLRIYDRLVSSGKQLEPREKFYYARELYYNKIYSAAIRMFNEFLDEGNGWIENNINACKDLAACYYLMNDEDAALQTLFRSFVYDNPRAEICCDIGKHFVERGLYHNAIYWYMLATKCERDVHGGGFFLLDCAEYLPYIQICVCYDRLGDIQKAIEYNEKAGAIKPNDKSYLYNKQYFERLLGLAQG